jgi:purine-nucleoside/S-methyl-5'-thioadenosine phosphorylase / adenosine deaminase
MTAGQPLRFLRPDWDAPTNVRAVVTTREGGASDGPYASFNLAEHTGDDPARVRANRTLLRDALKLPAEPTWLEQIHGTVVVDIAGANPKRMADGAYTNRPGVVCAVLTADCLPIFLCDRSGSEAALVHAGWRGLAAGVIDAALARFRAPRADVLAWLGPAISAKAYEVGSDVRDVFVASDPVANDAFIKRPNGKWSMDLYTIARQRLSAAGVRLISRGKHCTATQADIFFSYRRDGVTGRMASLLWLE